jgi:hypothetical protein
MCTAARELFRRDPSRCVPVAPFVAGTTPDHHSMQAAAVRVLRAAHGGLESQPAHMDAGSWSISVGQRVLAVAVNVSPADLSQPTVPVRRDPAVTY